MKFEQTDLISRRGVLKFDNIKKGVTNIFEQIALNKICFRSLFQHDSNSYYMYDIMNACAAFEAQFEETYKNKFKFKEQSTVKSKMIKYIEDSRQNYSTEELEYFDAILNGFKNYRDTLKKRIEIALNEFKRIYEQINEGEEDRDYKIKQDFMHDYQSLPERIVNARNALDHGNLKYLITWSAFTDTELLRAVTYMLILQKAEIDDYDIMCCLEKMACLTITIH